MGRQKASRTGNPRQSREQSPPTRGQLIGEAAERDSSLHSSHSNSCREISGTKPSERSPTGQSPNLVQSPRPQSAELPSAEPAAKLDWDSAQEASEDERNSNRLVFPAGMSRRQVRFPSKPFSGILHVISSNSTSICNRHLSERFGYSKHVQFTAIHFERCCGIWGQTHTSSAAAS